MLVHGYSMKIVTFILEYQHNIIIGLMINLIGYLKISKLMVFEGIDAMNVQM